jgi:hypothetical protein
MNIIRRILIKAYFEATVLKVEDGLDYSVSKTLIDVLELSLSDYVKGEVEFTDGVYIQCDPGLLPPVGIVVDATTSDGKSAQVMIETDKFGKIDNFYWERV